MSAAHRDEPEQEISIRRREHELFRSHADESQEGPTRPFAEYLRETPAPPLSPGVKAVLWALAVVVALLFAAALWRSISRTNARAPKKPKTAPAASASATPRPARLPSSPNQES
jgi:cytoskeletal protein RodZ